MPVDHCELDLPKREECSAANQIPPEDFDFAKVKFIFFKFLINFVHSVHAHVVLFILQLEGDWFLMRVLRRDQTVSNSRLHFEVVNDDMYRLHYAVAR